MSTPHDKRYPNESGAYREARWELLEAEAELRARVEEVAAMRRSLPPGGEVPEDYVFQEGPRDLAAGDEESPVRMSQLFSEDSDTLFVYNFMFGPEWEQPCNMCTSILDALNGNASQLQDRIDVVVVARAPLARIREWARRRGWSNLRLLSSYDNTFNRDYFAEDEEGGQWPLANVFVRDDDGIRHHWSSELFFAPHPEGQDPRHVDLIWPLWNVLDLTPLGRESD